MEIPSKGCDSGVTCRCRAKAGRVRTSSGVQTLEENANNQHGTCSPEMELGVKVGEKGAPGLLFDPSDFFTLNVIYFFK